MIEIKIPKTLKKFGYKLEAPIELRRKALLRANGIIGKESMLFNLSSGLYLSKQAKDIKHYNIIKNDFKWLLKSKKIQI